MQCVVTYATGVYLVSSKTSSEIQISNMDTYHPDTPTYASKDVTIRGYFAKLKGAQKRLGNTAKDVK